MNAHHLTPARATWLVARREISTRVRSRAFVISTVVILAAIGGYVAFMVAVGQSASQSTVAVTPRTAALAGPIKTSADALGSRVQVARMGADAGRQHVRTGDVDALLVRTPDGLRVIVDNDLDDELRAAISAAARQQALNTRLRQAGLDPPQVRQAMAEVDVEVRALETSDPYRWQRFAIGLSASGLLYFSIVFYGMAVAQGVVEEKSSRVIELLLAAVRPWQLLAGKVVGIGLTGLLQFAILGGVGVAAAIGTGVLDTSVLRGTLVGTIGWALLWYLLGFFLFATLYAAGGSLVSRQEDINPVVQPLVFLALAPFLVGATLLQRNPESTIVEVLSLIPPFSPILMPARTALGVAPAWQIGLSVFLSVMAIAALVRLAGGIYARGVLHAGGRLSLRRAMGAS